MEFHHTTVLLHEMIDSVLTNPHGVYVDCTLGGGGHSMALSERLEEDALVIGGGPGSGGYRCGFRKAQRHWMPPSFCA